MTGNMEHGNWQFANGETVAIGPETIEIRAITAKFGSGVEDVAEHSLNVPDMPADRDRAAEPFLDPSCCRKMIGMRGGLQKPVDRDALGHDILNERFGRGVIGSAACRERGWKVGESAVRSVILKKK